MHWTDDALVIGTRPLGETRVVLEAMTRERGRHAGIVHGGRSRRMQPVLQPGNTVRLVWRARLDEQIGTFAVEPLQLRTASLIGSTLALTGAAALAAHLRLLAEREPHPALYEAAVALADHLDDRDLAPLLFVRFEAMLLGELGFGLDLASCAVTRSEADLAFVSPRTGRAVSREAAEPYRSRLLPLPPFLFDLSTVAADRDEVAAGFRLTGHFLERHVFEPRGGAGRTERERFVAALSGAATRPAAISGPNESETAET